ncbi:hypothetical protein EVAR_35317_1 [Eumeta japonica]|uniref:Uncharacterized protein n=1 Tax=Eumeta variegata TaxID=151549 RepID=A0A4C1XMC4_EUMVA|nr:hypothetical protein EVAR_35317_1 [Eumeta japonica]
MKTSSAPTPLWIKVESLNFKPKTGNRTRGSTACLCGSTAAGEQSDRPAPRAARGLKMINRRQMSPPAVNYEHEDRETNSLRPAGPRPCTFTLVRRRPAPLFFNYPDVMASPHAAPGGGASGRATHTPCEVAGRSLVCFQRQFLIGPLGNRIGYWGPAVAVMALLRLSRIPEKIGYKPYTKFEAPPLNPIEKIEIFLTESRAGHAESYLSSNVAGAGSGALDTGYLAVQTSICGSELDERIKSFSRD